MDNNTGIIGNIFSNGNIIAGNGAYVTEDVIVASNGNKIDNLWVGGDATVHTCVNSDITGTLTYVAGGSIVGCDADVEIKSRPNQIDPEPLPISITQINNWKNEASCDNNPVCIYFGDYVLDLGGTESLGPMKITGNLTIRNISTLIMTGTLYVAGDIIVDNNGTLKLDALYSSTSGVVVSDGHIIAGNNSNFETSGTTGSYIMMLTTNNSLDMSDPAIDVSNNALGVVFYAANGLIKLNNNMQIREATGYKIHLNNNAVIDYEVGLQNTNFSSGPSGGWQVTSWKEVE